MGLFTTDFAAIGLISFLILEITTVVGCIFDMRTAVQALVLVAIGTSLPPDYINKRLSWHYQGPSGTSVPPYPHHSKSLFL